jgi:hypothetical protein
MDLLADVKHMAAAVIVAGVRDSRVRVPLQKSAPAS